MKIAVGCDHGGYELKKIILPILNELGYSVKDFGTYSSDSVDYPDIAIPVAKAVAKGEYDRGILICGTGIGMSIAANKIKDIRAALVHDLFSAKVTRNHNNSNILCMGGRIIGPSIAESIVRIWLENEFDGGRHLNRVNKIKQFEEE